MTPFTAVAGLATVLTQGDLLQGNQARANIDTDQIIPARFLRKPRSDGYNNFLFYDARAADPGFPLSPSGNRPILIAGLNFGCGSSREGAVYALVDAGIRCVMALGFGDIFSTNAGKNGLLTVVLPPDDHAAVLRAAADGVELTVSLPDQQIRFGNQVMDFPIDLFLKRCLLNGLDDIGLTLDESARIAAFEVADSKRRPWSIPD
ncbi:3-isopropylmalate dehydratase small subunit [Rhodopila sp.]|uniref:3-isopropylmalate dehydratase small subunit n=1 Tax=Rhodopila sp. TaxID=2480087 RepID=UPI003D130437